MKKRHLIALVLAALLAFVPAAGALGEGDVTAMQDRLKELGYLDGATDGSYGAQTRDAVKKFKGQAYLPYDDIADEETLSRLFADDAPAYQAFDYALLEGCVEDFYYDSEAKRWVWESSANYLDYESWPRDVIIGEPYGAMGIHATGNRRGRLNRITWKFFCFTEEPFVPELLSVSFPDGDCFEAPIHGANRATTEFTEQFGNCTVVSCELDEAGIGLLSRIAHLPDDALDDAAIALSGEGLTMTFDLQTHNVSYDPFIEDLRLFVRAWGEAGGFSAPMARPGNTGICFESVV